MALCGPKSLDLTKESIFKSLALSKIVYLALLTIAPKSIIEELNEIQKKFLWSNKKCKIKHGTLCNDYKNGGSKNVYINLRIVSLKCLWIRTLYNECHHDWKIIPLNYIYNALGKNFKFHSNLSTPEVPSLVSSQFLWYNSYIKIDNKVVCYKDFADKNINYVSDLFDENGELKSWQKILRLSVDPKILLLMVSTNTYNSKAMEEISCFE